MSYDIFYGVAKNVTELTKELEALRITESTMKSLKLPIPKEIEEKIDALEEVCGETFSVDGLEYAHMDIKDICGEGVFKETSERHIDLIDISKLPVGTKYITIYHS